MNNFLLLFLMLCLNYRLIASGLLVRKSPSSMTADEWRSLERGFRVMAGRANSDVTSYYYQYALHGWPMDRPVFNQTLADEKGWTRGQHAQWWFLAWHRMYLYYFERILRRASADPELTLPYWDFYVPLNRRVPEAYRRPADERSNALYRSHRCPNANSGDEFHFDEVDHVLALTELEFESPANSTFGIPYPVGGFGGGRVQSPVFDGPNEGSLESRPHDGMHWAFRGPNNTLLNSASDPLFFLLHAEIDRLWDTWLSQSGRRNPTAGHWLDYRFYFIDEFGRSVSHTARESLESGAQLGYRYETLAELPTRRQQRSPDILIGSLSARATANPVFVTLNRTAVRRALIESPAGSLSGAEFRVLLNGSFSYTDTAFVAIYVFTPHSLTPKRVTSVLKIASTVTDPNRRYFRFPPSLSATLLSRTDWSRAEYFTFVFLPTMCDQVLRYSETDNYNFDINRMDLFLH